MIAIRGVDTRKKKRDPLRSSAGDERSAPTDSRLPCAEEFWLCPRRRGPSRTGQWSIPKAGCDGGANAGHSQKDRRPEDFRGKGSLASLLLGYGPILGIRPRRVSPFCLFRENRTPRNIRTGSKLNTSTQALGKACTAPTVTMSLITHQTKVLPR